MLNRSCKLVVFVEAYTDPIGCSSTNCSHGLRCTCFRPSEMRRLERGFSALGGLMMLYTGVTVPGIGLALGLVAFASQKVKQLRRRAALA